MDPEGLVSTFKIADNYFQIFFALTSGWFSLDGSRMPHQVIKMYNNPPPLFNPGEEDVNNSI